MNTLTIYQRIVAAVCLVVLTIFLLVSCHSSPPQVVYSQAQPVQQPIYADPQAQQVQQPQVIQAAPPVVVQQGSNGGLVEGMILGHMMSGGGYGGGYGHTVVNHTTVVHAAPQVPTYRPAQTPIYRTTPSRGISTTRTATGGFSVGRRR